MIRKSKLLKAAIILLLVVGLMCIFVGSCLAQTPRGRQVTVSLGVDLSTLDPYGHSDIASFSMWRHVMEPLIHYDFDKRSYYGCLAESWKAEGTQWIFKLRKGVKFHNGVDFTARDVKFSLDLIRDRSKQAPMIADIKDVNVVDDYTVRIVTKEPAASFISKLENIVMISQQVYRQYGDEAVKHPIGTGPFKYVEWVRGNHFVAEKNASYWGGPAKHDKVIWMPIKEDAARITALENGTIDIADAIPSHEADRLEKNPNIRIEQVRVLRLIQVGLHQNFKPFQNKLVRMAMNYAVDVDSLVKHVLDGRAYRANGLSGPNSLGYGPELKPFPYDPVKAKSLLAQAGYPNGFEVEFYAPTGRYPKDRELAQAIAGQLAKVGIKANVITPEWSIYWSSVLKGKYPMYYFGAFNHPDPEMHLSLFFESGVTPRLGYSNPEVDRAIKEQRAEFDLGKRDKLLQKAIRLILDDVPTIVLYHHKMLYGVRKNVIWKATPEDMVLVHDASVRE